MAPEWANSLGRAWPPRGGLSRPRERLLTQEPASSPGRDLVDCWKQAKATEKDRVSCFLEYLGTLMRNVAPDDLDDVEDKLLRVVRGCWKPVRGRREVRGPDGSEAVTVSETGSLAGCHQSGVQSSAQSSAQCGAQSDVQSDAQSDAQPDNQSGAQSDAQSGAQSDAQSDVQPDVLTGMMTLPGTVALPTSRIEYHDSHDKSPNLCLEGTPGDAAAVAATTETL
ncbi:hypothetical protein FJT64_025933 [Amphibalanus amphitrite]|uniref:Uncharacterized protein n=1 Tax=Amphibalanus amphitrite TaxID=1232801 RepID=A0A6A4WII9_AMPAM|nr:hypothetical protein FJT64_025933 [Amphibalanus amphitrite]